MSASRSDSARWRGLAITRWPLWSLPRAALGFVVVTGAAAVVAALSMRSPAGMAELGLAALLTALCVLQHEAALSAETARRRVSASTEPAAGAGVGIIIPTSVYTMAAALLLSPLLLAVVVIGQHLHRFARINRHLLRDRGAGYRAAFDAASIVLAGTAVHLVQGVTGFDLQAGLPSVGPLLLVLALVLTYAVVQFALIAGAMSLSLQSAAPARAMAVATGKHALEFAQLGIGALVAFLLASPSPWLTALVAPILWLIARAVLVSELEAEAASDAATGLLNAAAWHRRATAGLQRARRTGTPLGVLIIDLDAFRHINQLYGSRAGDRVLTAAACALLGTVHDGAAAIGRMHGEEFVVMAPAADATDVERIAGRIATAIRELDLTEALGAPGGRVPQLTASFGGATWPADADGIDSLLAAADTALRRAKAAGPGQIRLASPGTGFEAAREPG